MNLVFKNLLDYWPLAYIKESDIKNRFRNEDAKRHSLVKRAVQAGRLVRLKKGLYGLKNSPYQLANIIYSPSYISFETALFIHGLIPEYVHIIRSATPKKNKIYETGYGTFEYVYIPPKHFLIGVEKKEGFLIASPFKALIDILFSQNRNWQNLHDAMDDLRIESEAVFPKRKDFDAMMMHCSSKKLLKFLNTVPKEILI